MKPYSLHREALEEFDAAAAYYAQIDPALGQRFYDVIDRLIAEACLSPGTFRFIRKPARRHFTRDVRIQARDDDHERARVAQ